LSLAEWIHAREVPVLGHRFFAVEGRRMRCLTGGDGPAVLLLHGLLGTADAWGPVAARLAAGSTVYAPDALCVGGSDRAAELDASLAATADRYAAMMDAAGVAAADVVGTSHGGAVAMMMAARHPARVRSLVLHAPANPFSDIADPMIHFYRTPLGRWFAERVPHLPAGVQTLALGRMYGDAGRVRCGSLEPYIASLRVPGTVAHLIRILDGWEGDMAALAEALPGLRGLPVQLIWGDRDRAVSMSSGERLAACFEGGRLIVIPGAGHLPHEEMPATFAQVVEAFLHGVSRRRERGEEATRGASHRDAA
jgi:pimeloyl-ACP methyl ester carboxylesterase